MSMMLLTGAGRQGGFSPQAVAGLQLWLKADAIVGLNDGDPVSTWADASGNGRDLTQALTKRPTYKTNIVNGLPVVRFDGTNDVLISPSFSYEQPSTIFMVNKTTSSDFKYWFSSRGGFGMAAYQNAGSPTLSMYAGSAGQPASNRLNGSLPPSSFELWRMKYNGASSALHLNNAAQTYATGSPGSNSGDGLYLGNRYDESLPAGVDFAEFLIYDPAPGASDVAAIEAYLATKYGITLS